jgi:hypothetical protein
VTPTQNSKTAGKHWGGHCKRLLKAVLVLYDSDGHEECAENTEGVRKGLNASRAGCSTVVAWCMQRLESSRDLDALIKHRLPIQALFLITRMTITGQHASQTLSRPR